MKTLLYLQLAACIHLAASLASAAEIKWLKWPKDAGPDAASIRYPATFKVIKPQVLTKAKPLLNIRICAPDGSCEFALTAISARGMAKTIEARSLPLPLAPGERITSSKPISRQLRSELGDYIHFSEDITVEGPKGSYIRYFKRELSTSNLPGASSVLWEFQVTGTNARQANQQLYGQFKKSHDLGEF